MNKINHHITFLKRVFFSCFLFFIPFLNAQTPSSTENYILSVDILEPMTSVPSNLNSIPDAHKKVSIVYFDDLGREKQSILYKGTPDGKDIVTKIKYDGFGRQLEEYLPAPTTQTSGAFIPDPTAAYTSHYGAAPYNTSVYFSEKELESSPLSRVVKQAAPGEDWQLGSGHEIKFQYHSNSATEVDLYWMDGSGNLRKGNYTGIGNFYPARSLYRTITTDENGHATHEYKDKQGRVVLTRSFVVTDTEAKVPGPGNPPTEKVDTYYVYDNYGNLVYVVPPKAAATTTVGTVSTTIIKGLCYRYKYDKYNRMVERQLPGKEAEYMVYDKQNRLVATQDGEMRKTTFTFPSGMTGKAWAFTKYDKFGRVVYTGLYLYTGTQATLQTLVNGYGSNNETQSGSFSQNAHTVYYTKANAFPKNHTSANSDLLTVNYYDKYIPAMLSEDDVTIPSSVEEENDIRNGDNDENESLKGLPVASHVRVLPDEGWERTYTFYDGKSRPVYTHKVNHLEGMTTVKSKLKFRGMPQYIKTYHKRDGSTLEIETKDNFIYDNMERLLSHTQNLNNSSTQNLIALNQYDKLGQLLNKKVGGTDVSGTNRWQQVDYKYNIRGWLTDINNVGLTLMGKDAIPPGLGDDLFAFKINYNFLVNGGGDYVEPLYNGNISQTLWKTASDNKLRGYVYEYDRLNRLTDAIFYKNDINPYAGNYNEHLAYDLNGNITELKRYGGYENQSLPDEMDLLTYTYTANSNLLVKVVDDGQDNTGFIDSPTNTSNDYTYDDNGNMISDKNKGITSIKYNHLNLPSRINFDSGDYIEYKYNAVGQKISKFVSAVNTHNEVKHVEYLDGFQYTGAKLNFFPHPEGYVNVTLGTTGNRIFNYVYNYTDHLGNIRLTYTKDMVSNELKIMDENHYYPFGLKHQKYSSGSKLDLMAQSADIARPGYATSTPFMYKYQGQERQDELGLNWYSFKYRNYDPAIARFFNVDPLSEQYHWQTHYAFSENRVIDGVELEGLERVSIHTASYAPFNSFGKVTVYRAGGVPLQIGPFKGDGASRTAGTDPNASSRVYGRTDLDLGASTAKETLVGVTARGSESHNLQTGESTYSEASATTTVTKDGNTVGVNMHVSGNNDLVPGSPDIDVKPSLTMTVTPMEGGGKAVQITGQVRGDGFPANETYITDQSGNGVLLGSSQPNAGPNMGPVTSLPGDNSRPMSTIDTTIYFDNNDNITGSSATGSW